MGVVDTAADSVADHHADKTDEALYDGRLLKSQCAGLYERAQTLYAFARLYLAFTYGRYHVNVKKDNDVVAAHFPNVKGVELLTPAFVHPESIPSGFFNGTNGPTENTELDHFIRSLAARHDWITYRKLDFQSEDGRSFPVLFLSSSSHVATSKQPRANKLRIWIQAAVHGNEPAGDQAALALLGKMDADEAWTASILDKVDIFMLPRYNPDGVAGFRRTLLTGIDLNRDHIKFASQQTRSIKRVFNDFSPHIAIDMHEFSAPIQYGGMYRRVSDALFSAGKNLNIHPLIRQIGEELFAPMMARDLEARGLRWEPYVTGRHDNSTIVFTEAGSDAKMGRNAMGLTQCLTFLPETRDIGIADQQFQRRTAASLTMVESIIQTAADNATKVYNTIESAIQNFTRSNDDITVTDSPRLQPRDFNLVNFDTGVIEKVPVRFFSTTPTIPKIKRARPEAYIIPASWTDLASRLQDAGLEVITLPYAYHGTVEAYNIKTAAFEDTYYEGVVPVNVTTEIVTRQIDLAPGAFWISTRQKNAGLAFVVIEPENVDSWVRFDIVPAGVGDQLPLFRVMKGTQ